MFIYSYDRRQAAGMTPESDKAKKDFIAEVEKQLQIKDRVIRWNMGALRSHDDDAIYVNFFNLPNAKGGAEAENNRVMLEIEGFQSPKAKLKVGERVNMLGDWGTKPPFKLRGKTGTPQVIARTVAQYLNRIVKEIPPKFTHSKK